ncbi:MAG TPA: hypothetical protein VF533_21750 [Solirubrobacteraceae bacterium]
MRGPFYWCFAAATVLFGAASTLLVQYADQRSFNREFAEQAEGASSWLPGGLFLLGPYVLLAAVARNAKPGWGFTALAVMLVIGLYARAVAAADPNGALIYVLVVPVQAGIALLVGASGYRGARVRERDA